MDLSQRGGRGLPRERGALGRAPKRFQKSGGSSRLQKRKRKRKKKNFMIKVPFLIVSEMGGKPGSFSVIVFSLYFLIC